MKLRILPATRIIKRNFYPQGNSLIIPLSLLYFTFYAAPVQAYLDPGSGSAIISVIAATIGSLWFSAKSMMYRLTGKRNIPPVAGKNTLIIFSEDKAYWGTFKPLVEELIRQEIFFRYRTLDVHDPALTIENEYMQAKRLSHSSLGFSELVKMEAPLMLATTPNIGVNGYPLKKPKKISNLIHIFHHIGDIASYKKHSLDHYDSVILAGEFQKESIRVLESLRGLKAKSLIALGLPYLDDLYSSRTSGQPSCNERKTVLVGSSWGNKGCLRSYGTEFINVLAEAGYDVIVRPHPQSFISEPEFIERCERETTGEFVQWDTDVSPILSMHKAHILISDTSSLRFDFAFLYEKPVITLEIPKSNLVEFEGRNFENHWHTLAAYQVGIVAEKDSISNIVHLVERALHDYSPNNIRSFRQRTLKNFGNCSTHIIDYVKKLLQDQEGK